jgi:hypothetical protein
MALLVGLSLLPAVACVVAGMMVTQWLKSRRTDSENSEGDVE